MKKYLLVLVYMIFTSVGLSTFVLGAAWPVMQNDLELPLYGAGVLSLIMSSGMIISSFLGGKIIKRIGNGKMFFISMIMTAIAVICYGVFPTFNLLCLASLPLGLGLGALNMNSNHFLSLNYKPSHMNWMHGFWGIGATIGPLIMSFYIAQNNAWKKGYVAIAMIYFILAVILFFSLPSFNQTQTKAKQEENSNKKNSFNSIIKIPKLKLTLVCFFCCCAIEQTIGLWGSSYLLSCKNINAENAAACLSIFFAGVTIGRFVSGIATIKLEPPILIKIGLWIEIIGGILMILPLQVVFSMVGLILIGFGSSPIVPCMIQQTADKFGLEVSGTIVGYQIACGFLGSTIIPPIFGWIADKTTLSIFTVVILLFIIILTLSNNKINRNIIAKE